MPQIGQSLTIMPISGGGGNPGIHRECTVGFLRARSAFIEAVLARYLRQQTRAQIEARDLELINKAGDELNEEVEDVLHYQET